MKITKSFFNTIKFAFCTKKNPYYVLGLKPDASEDQIKKTFRQIAQKYHPDKNPDPKAQQKFVAAKQAYETLTDIDKRRQFDNESKYSGNREYGFDKNPFDEFNEDIFKDKSRVYHETYSTGSSRRKKGENIQKEIKISFLQAVKGTKYKLKYERKGTCETCHGNRCKPGTAPSRCLACGGSGSTIFRQNSIVMHLECSRCSGTGLIIKNPCQSCKATGIKVLKDEEELQIPEGIEDGQALTFKGKGDQSENGPSGDLFVKVQIQKHPKFRRNGSNIQTTQWITVSEAALGTQKDVQTIWGKGSIKIEEGSQDGTKIKLKRQGIRKVMNEGDHICLVRIKIPKKLTLQQKAIFRELAKIEDKIIPENEQKEKQSEGVGNKFRDYFR